MNDTSPSRIFSISIAIGLFLCLCGLLVGTTPIAAASEDREVALAPAPAWVSPVAVDEPTADQLAAATDGLFYALLDVQWKWQPGEKQQYKRIVAKIVDRSGLEEAGDISVTFDPEWEQLTLHSIVIRRGGETIDITKQTKFQIFQREEDLDSGIIRGVLTAHANLEGIVAGDIVDYAFSITERSPLFKDRFAVRSYASYNVPLGKYHLRIVAPNEPPLQVRVSTGLDAPQREVTPSGLATLEWQQTDLAPDQREDDVPDWRPQRRIADVSNYQSWQEVADRHRAFYDQTRPLPKDFAHKVDAISQKHTDPATRLALALRLVQNDIRYVALTTGLGGFVPSPPKLVVQRGFGDCKDKTLLLLTALKRLGIEAHPALTHSKRARRLPVILPTAFAFDHVIVRATINGKPVWVDPTLTHQGGIGDDLAPPDFGWVLPLADGNGELEAISSDGAQKPTTTSIETIQFSENTAAPSLSLSAYTVYWRDEADFFRRELANTPRDQLAKRYLNYFREIYPGLQKLGDLTIDDDLDRNRIEVREYYSIPPDAYDAKALLKRFRMRASILSNVLPDIDSKERISAVKLPFPYHRLHTVRVLNAPEKLDPMDPVSVNYPEIEARFSSQATTDSLNMQWLVKVKAPEISAPRFNRLAKDYKNFDDHRTVYYTLYDDKKAAPSNNADVVSAVLGNNAGLFIFLFIFIGGFTTLAIVSLWWGLRADRAYRADGFYFPVSYSKYVLMCLVTNGVYASFWMWKFWRWQKDFKGARVWPWARFLFSFVFYYPTNKIANAALSAEDAIRRRWQILAAVIGFIIFFAANSIGFGDDNEPLSRMDISAIIACWLFGSLSGIGSLPALIAVNRLNEPHRDVMRRNSKLNALNIFGVIVALGMIIALACVFIVLGTNGD